MFSDAVANQGGVLQASALMRFVARGGHPFWVWELGNEPNAWPMFHRGLFISPEVGGRVGWVSG